MTASSVCERLNGELIPQHLNESRWPASKFSIVPELSSVNLGWDLLCLQRFRMAPIDLSAYTMSNLMIHVHRKDPIFLEICEGGRLIKQRIVPDDIFISPPGCTVDVAVRQPFSFLSISFNSFTPESVSIAIDENSRTGSLEVVTQWAIRDRHLLDLSLLLEHEARTGGENGRLYAEGLSTALLARLLCCYSSNRLSPIECRRGLAPYKLRRVCEYIEANLASDLSLAELARLAGMSSYHFARVFKQSTGISPHQHLTRRRVERAQELLSEGSRPLVDVAHEIGYKCQSHFTAVFRKMTGVTPSAFRLRVRQ